MNKKYIVCLSMEEQTALQAVIKKLNGSSQKVRRAQLLLKADADGPALPDGRIAEAFNCQAKTVENLRPGGTRATENLPLNFLPSGFLSHKFL